MMCVACYTFPAVVVRSIKRESIHSFQPCIERIDLRLGVLCSNRNFIGDGRARGVLYWYWGCRWLGIFLPQRRAGVYAHAVASDAINSGEC